jgi:hypothetical protein
VLSIASTRCTPLVLESSSLIEPPLAPRITSAPRSWMVALPRNRASTTSKALRNCNMVAQEAPPIIAGLKFVAFPRSPRAPRTPALILPTANPAHF